MNLFPLGLESGVNLAMALVIGVGFGFFLEKAGFSNAKKLVGVFYLYDMAVIKVMFTAVVTAMFGLVIIGAVGLLDISQLYIEPTNYWAAGIGGLIFGAGFVIGGYCPGTSVVGASIGKIDALFFMLGIFISSYIYAEFFNELDQWISSKAVGELTLGDVTGLGSVWWVGIFVMILAVMAARLKKLEKWN